MNKQDYKQQIIIPTLDHLSIEIPYTEAAVNLILLTAIAESDLYHLTQVGGGPALGLLQMEPSTEDSLWQHQLRRKRPGLAGLIDDLSVTKLGRKINLAGNPFYQVAMARTKYFANPSPLPNIGDIDGMSEYYKVIYNTVKGAADLERVRSIYKFKVLDQ